ncbi:MAG: cation diffusion facilitator family transporter [Candidatus Lokiarchaeota archaeon]|nr:cation diffusion facilitator family transporter [Candidatus Lokiarchaeota archaeon]
MDKLNQKLNWFERPIFINTLLLAITTLFFIFKLFLGFYLNSLALQADAIDNLTDVIFIITGLIGIFFVNKKPNEKFPYGYYKIENIISLIISLLIFYSAYSIIQTSIIDIINIFRGSYRVVTFIPAIFIILIIFLIGSFGLTLYLYFVGKRNNSPIIQSEAKEKLYDNLISFSVILSFIGVFFNIFLFDSIISLFIAVFIIKGGYDIFLSSTKILLDAVIDFDKRKELWKLVEKMPNIKEIKNLDIRAYGRYKFLEIDLHLDKDMPLSQINTLEKDLERKIKKNYPEFFKIVIIAHGIEFDFIKIAVPLENDNGEKSKISKHYGESPFFAIFVVKDGVLQDLKIIQNKFASEEKRKGILVSDWLISEKINKIYLKNVLKKGPYIIFNNNYIDTVVTELVNLDEIISIEKEKSIKN